MYYQQITRHWDRGQNGFTPSDLEVIKDIIVSILINIYRKKSLIVCRKIENSTYMDENYCGTNGIEFR